MPSVSARPLLARGRHGRRSADALLLATVLIWSFNFTAVKYAVSHDFEPLAYAALRFSAGSLFFAGMAYRLESTLRVGRRELWLLAGLAGGAMYLNQISFISSVELTTAATVALLFGTVPILVGLIGWRMGVERPHRRHWIAAALSFGGVALVASGSEADLSGDLGGILVGLVAPATWAFYTVLVAPLLRRYSPLRISAVVGLGATLPLLATAAPALADEEWARLDWLAWGALAYSMLASLVLTNVLWFKAVDLAGANRAALYSNLQPFLGALFAVVTLGERLSALQIGGGAVIAAGILLSRPRRPPVEVVD